MLGGGRARIRGWGVGGCWVRSRQGGSYIVEKLKVPAAHAEFLPPTL